MSRVLCAMSGGVDSSVAAALLIEQGHEVIGVTMKLWRGEDDPFAAHRFGGCCTIGAVEDARQIAANLDIPYYVLNMQEEFSRAVVDDFVDEYAAGRTPNPCARCNQFIKFHAFVARADELDCDFIATGHYARIEEENGVFHLRRGEDYKKDQSYVLGMLGQRELARTLLPIGHLNKEQTRKIAEGLGMCVARKPDSQEICFVEDGDYAKFVTQRNPRLAQAGAIVDERGETIGEHRGIAHYTVGQRKGLGVSAPIPLFVNKIDANNNRIMVGPRELLKRQGLKASAAQWSHEAPAAGMEVFAQTRAHAAAHPAKLVDVDATTFELSFDAPYEGVTPGQLCVLYDGDRVLGAGTIEN